MHFLSFFHNEKSKTNLIKKNFYFHQQIVTDEVQRGLYDGATINELMTLAAETAATRTTEHSDYGMLAGRIVVDNMHKATSEKFSGLSVFINSAEINNRLFCKSIQFLNIRPHFLCRIDTKFFKQYFS